MGGEGTAGWNAHAAEVVNAAARTGRHDATKIRDNIGRGRSRSWRFAVVRRPLLDGSIDTAEVVNASHVLCLNTIAAVQLLSLGESLRRGVARGFGLGFHALDLVLGGWGRGGGLGRGVARGFGLGLHALDLGLGRLSLEGELRVLITHVANLVAQAED